MSSQQATSTVSQPSERVEEIGKIVEMIQSVAADPKAIRDIGDVIRSITETQLVISTAVEAQNEAPV